MKLTNQVRKENSMTCLQGYVEATYDQLKDAIEGSELILDADHDSKVSTEFQIEHFEAVTITVYDWKEYDGGRAARSNNLFEWHIGGNNRMVVEALNDLLDNAGYEPTATYSR